MFYCQEFSNGQVVRKGYLTRGIRHWCSQSNVDRPVWIFDGHPAEGECLHVGKNNQESIDWMDRWAWSYLTNSLPKFWEEREYLSSFDMAHFRNDVILLCHISFRDQCQQVHPEDGDYEGIKHVILNEWYAVLSPARPNIHWNPAFRASDINKDREWFGH